MSYANHQIYRPKPSNAEPSKANTIFYTTCVFSSPRLAIRAEMSRSPRLAYKAPVMQAIAELRVDFHCLVPLLLSFSQNFYPGLTLIGLSGTGPGVPEVFFRVRLVSGTKGIYVRTHVKIMRQWKSTLTSQMSYRIISSIF